MFKISGLQRYCAKGMFVLFTAVLSFVGALVGLAAGYFASEILIEANMQSYLVTGLVRGLSIKSIVVGLFVPGMVFSLLTYVSFYLIRGKEIGLLIAGISQNSTYTIVLRFANKVAGIFPVKRQAAIRLAFRKPIAVLLIILSVMSFSVMFILAYSLTLSSQKVFDSQIMGHQYLYETQFDAPLNSSFIWLPKTGYPQNAD